MQSFKDIVKLRSPTMKKGAAITKREVPISGTVKITKADKERQLAFGWANVSVTASGEKISDYQNDSIEPEELEKAAYKYVELYRIGGEMHETVGCAVLVESVMFTKEKQAAIGIPAGKVPEGWWVGFHITDPDVWKKVKDGEYPMFSIGGNAIREEKEDDSEDDESEEPDEDEGSEGNGEEGHGEHEDD